MTPFSEDAIRAIFEACKGHTIKHTDKGAGIILRHDVDNHFDKSYRCSLLQDEYGIKGTYFILNTASYWGKHWDEMRDMQDRGHEIAWHNDALSEWVIDKSQDLESIIRYPIERMRSEGLKVIGTVAHGNRLCYKHGFINYQTWRGANDTTEDLDYRKGKFSGISNRQFLLQDFGLQYDGMLTVHKDTYASESGNIWFGDITPRIKNIIKEGKRMIILIHPQHWDI
jgi:hypothetical protein